MCPSAKIEEKKFIFLGQYGYFQIVFFFLPVMSGHLFFWKNKSKKQNAKLKCIWG